MGYPQESDEFCNEIIGVCRELFGEEQFNIVQVGCLDAYEARWVKDKMKNCSGVIGFEPNPNARDVEEIDFRRVAISNFNGKAMLSSVEHSGLSSLNDRGGEKVEVDVQTLDSALGGSDCNVLIIDTEGTTLDVLEGAQESLKQCKLVIAEVQTEIREQVKDYLSERGLEYMEGHGYNCGPQANWFYARGWTPHGEG